jgi:glycosyltransferase involved in cell wall biosynthesis
MIPAYNCTGFLKETIQSVIDQFSNYSSVQVEVVDDCSTDANVEEVVRRVGKGEVGYYRQATNVGSLRNFETCIKRAKGKYIHLLHGDDRVKQGFYDKMERLLDSNDKIGAAFCRTSYIDEKSNYLFTQDAEANTEGVLNDILIRLGEHQRIETPSIVVKKGVYERIGLFRAVTYGEDWDMWIRIAASYPIAYTPEVLAEYRRQADGSITSQKILTGQNIYDLEHVMQLTHQYFPPEKVDAIQKKAKRYYAAYAIRTADKLWHRKQNVKGALNQVKAAFHFSKSPEIMLAAAKVLVKILIRYK